MVKHQPGPKAGAIDRRTNLARQSSSRTGGGEGDGKNIECAATAQAAHQPSRTPRVCRRHGAPRFAHFLPVDLAQTVVVDRPRRAIGDSRPVDSRALGQMPREALVFGVIVKLQRDAARVAGGIDELAVELDQRKEAS